MMIDVSKITVHPVWKDHIMIGELAVSRAFADSFNAMQNVLYIGFTEEEKQHMNSESEKEI